MTDNRKHSLQRIALIVLSAVLLILSFPGFNFEFLAWIALIPLFFALEGQRPLKAFLLSYFAGVLFFLGTIYWLIHVTFPGMIVVVLYLSLYFGFFGLIVSLPLKTRNFKTLFFIPAVWVALELMRSRFLSGFGWALLAHSQSFSLPVIQVADITGAYGVSFLVVLINTALFLSISGHKKNKKAFIYIAVAAFILYLAIAYGSYRLKNIFTGESIKIGVVQGNIPQKQKWDANFRSDIINKYVSLTKEAVKDNPSLIIWPESSVPGLLESEKDLFNIVSSLAARLKAHLLVGSPEEDPKIKDVYYNSAVLFGEDGKVAGRYNKIHLVPFGEYVPFRPALSFIDNFAPSPIGDFTAGKKYTVFRFFMERSVKDMKLRWKLVKKINFSCLICFEDIFPDMAREFVNNGAVFLVNITNDAWYRRTSATYQHAQNAVFRAVENRVNVVRAANTGMSCFIDQKGRITDRIEKDGKDIFVDGYKTADITLTRTRTFYTVFGDVFAYSCVIFSILYILFNRRKRWSQLS